MIATIDGATVAGTPEEIAELLRRRAQHVGGAMPQGIRLAPQCTCGKVTGLCPQHPNPFDRGTVTVSGALS